MQTMLQDIRYGLRQLIKMPGFTLTAILSLALGIGATTAVFSVVYAILMDPYPYAANDRMVHMRLLTPTGDNRGFGLTGTQWEQIRKSPVVEDAFTEDDWNLTVTGSDVPEDVQAVYLSSNSFNFLGVPPALGRGLQPSDSIDGQDPQPVVVLGYKFWQRHFNSDRAVLGKTMQLVRNTYTIVGVAAPRFTWGDGDVYLPMKITPDPARGNYVGLRLKPGVSHATADAALQPLINQFAKETPKHFPPGAVQKLHVVGLNEDFIKQLGGTLYLLFGAVALLLAIGCGNVSILQLARATARNHEFAVRSAVGASRGRIVRQLLTEALLLSITGAAIGLFLAYRTLSIIVANLPEYSFPHEAAIHINIPVLIFSIAIAVATGVLFGLWPALQLSRPEVSQIMQSNTRKTTKGVEGRNLHNALIAGQIALTLLMLAGAGAAIEGFLRLMHTNLGYDPHNIMSVGIPIHDGTYKTWSERAPYFEALLSKVGEVPGVTMTAISSNATPPSNGFTTKFEIVGKPASEDQSLRFNMVSPEYFPALQIPVLAGRIWDQTENHRGAGVMVINQSLARKYFPAGDAVGHTLKMPEVTPRPPFLLTSPSADSFLIVGIVADKLDDGLSKPILPEVFVPYTAAMGMYTQILVKSNVPPLTLLHAIRVKVNSVDHDQQTNGDPRDLEHWISQEPEYARGRLVAWLFGAFAFLALMLAAVGLYSVVSYTVVQRTSEFGIRMALGAPRAHVLRIVFASTLLSVGSGIVAGLLLCVALSKVMAHWAEESQSSSRDPMLLLASTLALALVAAIACTLPARRAAEVDPMTAIRYE